MRAIFTEHWSLYNIGPTF